MKRIAKYLHIGMLLSLPFLMADCSTDSCSVESNNALACSSVKTVFIPMSVGTNLANQYHDGTKIRVDEDCSFYVDLSARYNYQQTRNEKCIASGLFGSNVLKFQGDYDSANNSLILDVTSGSGVLKNGRKDDALVATYFGFGRNADFSIDLCPRIQNHIIDLQAAFGFGDEYKVWFQVNAPIVYSKARINRNCAPKANGDLGTRDGLQSGGGTGAFTTARNAAPTYATKPFAANDANGVVDKINTDFDSDMLKADVGKVLTQETISFGISQWSTLSTNGSAVAGGGKSDTATIVAPPAQGNDVQTGTITSPKIDSATTVAEGLGGKTYGNLTRTYNLFKFDKCSSDWKVADLGLQLGYDFYKCDDKHFGLYLKAVVPTGTEIDKCFAKQVLSPVIGNGKHFELGAGLSAHAELWSCDENSFFVNVDGYLTHMFKKTQFRTFDRSNDPMSRYSVVKQLTHTGATEPSDAYAYNYMLAPLGDFNSGNVDVRSDVKGEAIIDFAYAHKDWEFGVGYHFSGQSKEKMTSCKTDVTDGYYYGYKGASFENNIVIPTAGQDGINATIYAKSSGDVVANGSTMTGSAYDYGIQAELINTGRPTAASDVFTLPDFNRSGLMEGQISNKVFGHIDYVWSDCSWAPEVGIMGSVSFSPSSYKTAEYWDVGAKLGFSY